MLRKNPDPLFICIYLHNGLSNMLAKLRFDPKANSASMSMLLCTRAHGEDMEDLS